jgi:hypothetical protein
MNLRLSSVLLLSLSPYILPGFAHAAGGTHCTFALDTSKAKVEWTAYKTTEKVGVTAGFKSTQFKTGKPARTVPAALRGATAKIDGLSVESNNELRNANLKQAFFGLLKDKADIQAKIINAQGDDHQGSVEMSLSLNGTTRKVPMKYNVSETGIEATGTIDILEFNGSQPLKALNELCYELHKGKDGVSKTWSEVALRVTAPITKNCN